MKNLLTHAHAVSFNLLLFRLKSKYSTQRNTQSVGVIDETGSAEGNLNIKRNN
jgi:hypothetical protein